MIKRLHPFVFALSLVYIFNSCSTSEQKEKKPPNIILIYLDDLGYGDVSSYGSGTLKTPNIDKISNSGMRFTQGYSASATCTPSRYALLTGTYPWRNKRAKILTGANLILDTLELTLPKMLKNKGYQTGIIGKWHLGLGNSKINYNQKISPGPNEVGFDYSFILPDTQDRVPTVYIENGNVVNLDPQDPLEVDFEKNFEGQPTGKENPELLSMKWHHGHNGSIVNGVPRIGFMKGGEKAKWSDIDMADEFLNRAKKYTTENNNKPFFLFYSLQQPHVPRTPHPRFKGSSGMGPRGDAILEADWCIGALYSHLEENKLLENTLLIISSDNGPVLNDGYYDDAVEKLGPHTPSGPFRGGKYSLFEAGTRVPFITHWKGTIKPQISDEMVSQIDILNSIASLIGSEEKSKDGEDLSEVLFNNTGSGRNELILEAQQKIALRHKNWAYIPPYNGPKVTKYTQIEVGYSDIHQLYNLETDPSQKNNLVNSNPEKVEELIERYQRIVSDEN